MGRSSGSLLAGRRFKKCKTPDGVADNGNKNEALLTKTRMRRDNGMIVTHFLEALGHWGDVDGLAGAGGAANIGCDVSLPIAGVKEDNEEKQRHDHEQDLPAAVIGEIFQHIVDRFGGLNVRFRGGVCQGVIKMGSGSIW